MKSKLLNLGKQQWVVILLLGLLLAVAALPVSEKKNEKDTAGILQSTREEETEKTELEKKLEALLSRVEGVGEVEVVLMTEGGRESQGFSTSGALRVTGVLIAAQGAGDFVTVQNIQQAVMALFQVEAHKIKVMKMI